MNIIALISLALFVSISCYGDSRIVDQVSWKDSGGEHVIRVIEKKSGKYFESNWASSILVEKITKDKESEKLEWDIKDFSSNPSEVVHYVVNTLKIFDVENDGLMESSFTYIIATDGMDPDIIKQMVHKDDIKYAIRGEFPKQLSGIDEYKFKIDGSFSNQSLDFIVASLNIWNKNINKILKEIN